MPAGSAPAAAWRHCSQEVAEVLSQYLSGRQVEDGLNEGYVDLCLIPKPGKPPHRPSFSQATG